MLTDPWKFQAIIDCRFFTMFAVAGTLLGSVLCFLEVKSQNPKNFHYNHVCLTQNQIKMEILIWITGNIFGFWVVFPLFPFSVAPFRSWPNHATTDRIFRYVLDWNRDACIWNGIACHVRGISIPRIATSIIKLFRKFPSQGTFTKKNTSYLYIYSDIDIRYTYCVLI